MMGQLLCDEKSVTNSTSTSSTERSGLTSKAPVPVAFGVRMRAMIARFGGLEGVACLAKRSSSEGLISYAETAFGLGDLSQAGFQIVANELKIVVQAASAPSVGPMKDEDDIAGRPVVRKRLGVFFHGEAAGGVGRQEGEFLVLSRDLPATTGAANQVPSKRAAHPANQEGPASTNDMAEKVEHDGTRGLSRLAATRWGARFIVSRKR